VGRAFTARTTANSKGRFRFKKLPPGFYTITVAAPGAGMARRSVDVTPSLADSKQRVETTIPFSGSAVSRLRPPRMRNTVSVSELAISDRARHEYDQARARLGKQDSEAAVKRLKRAVELAPQFMMAWNELGTIAYRAGEWAEAESYFRKALALRPGALMTTLSLGGVLLCLGRPEEALEYNRFAVERSPNNVQAGFQLGVTYLMLHRDDEALRHLRVAKSLDPSHHSNPQLALAEIYVRRGDRTGAIEELKDLLARHPDAPNAQKVREEIARLTR
jgi:tetratricopeptide (TPR) repeat protein